MRRAGVGPEGVFEEVSETVEIRVGVGAGEGGVFRAVGEEDFGWGEVVPAPAGEVAGEVGVGCAWGTGFGATDGPVGGLAVALIGRDGVADDERAAGAVGGREP